MSNDDFEDKDYRDAFVDAMINTGIAFQVRALRKREALSQKDFGEKLGTSQNVVSRYENPDYGRFSLKTLQRLASAFDVALVVKFAPFSELRRLSKDRSPEALAVPSYSMEKAYRPEVTDSAYTSAGQTKVVSIFRNAKTPPTDQTNDMNEISNISEASSTGGSAYGRSNDFC